MIPSSELELTPVSKTDINNNEEFLPERDAEEI